MGRSPTNYVLPPGTTPQVPGTTITSAVWNAAIDDIAAAFNVPWPVAVGIGSAGATGSWDAINAKGADIASATSINLTTATGPNLTITGTTTVTGVTLADGAVRFARAAAAFQLTASASLIVNKSAATNYTTSADDLLIFIGGAGGVVRVWAIGGSISFATRSQANLQTSTTLAVPPAYLFYPGGFVNGLTIVNDTTDASNDLVIRVGTARSGDDTENINQGTQLIKQADASWAVGTNAGSLDTGAVGNNTYYIWEIKRPDTGVVDTLTSLSSTAPTMPANYTLKTLIGQFTRVGGVNGIPVNYNRPIIQYSGDAPVGACRAWVNFNGTGTVSIRASFNVSSVTDNGPGDYTVNFTAAMPDTNYAAQVTPKRDDSNLVAWGGVRSTSGAFATGSVRVCCVNVAETLVDALAVSVTVYR